MDKIKVIGGVAAGIGAVAALPVMGAIGTVSVLGALLGGTAGGIAGAVLSENDDDQFAGCLQRGEQRGREQCLRELDEMDGDLGLAKEKLATGLNQRSGGGFASIIAGISGRQKDEPVTDTPSEDSSSAEA